MTIHPGRSALRRTLCIGLALTLLPFAAANYDSEPDSCGGGNASSGTYDYGSVSSSDPSDWWNGVSVWGNEVVRVEMNPGYSATNINLYLWNYECTSIVASSTFPGSSIERITYAVPEDHYPYYYKAEVRYASGSGGPYDIRMYNSQNDAGSGRDADPGPSYCGLSLTPGQTYKGTTNQNNDITFDPTDKDCYSVSVPTLTGVRITLRTACTTSDTSDLRDHDLTLHKAGGASVITTSGGPDGCGWGNLDTVRCASLLSSSVNVVVDKGPNNGGNAGYSIWADLEPYDSSRPSCDLL